MKSYVAQNCAKFWREVSQCETLGDIFRAPKVFPCIMTYLFWILPRSLLRDVDRACDLGKEECRILWRQTFSVLSEVFVNP